MYLSLTNSYHGGVAALTTLSAFIVIIAIATTGWQHKKIPISGDRLENGLWETCTCSSVDANGM